MNKYIISFVFGIIWFGSSTAFEKEVSEFMHRTDGQIVHVGMNSLNAVRVGPDDSERVLLTIWLGGCTAVALVAENGDGERRGILSHYFSATECNEHERELRDVLIDLHKRAFTQASAIIMTPGTDDAGRLCPTFEALHNSLMLLIATAFKQKTIKTICYDMFAQDRHHALVVRIPGTKTEKRPSYRTWFCEGLL